MRAFVLSGNRSRDKQHKEAHLSTIAQAVQKFEYHFRNHIKLCPYQMILVFLSIIVIQTSLPHVFLSLLFILFRTRVTNIFLFLLVRETA